jgi:VWFA-related protein
MRHRQLGFFLGLVAALCLSVFWRTLSAPVVRAQQGETSEALKAEAREVLVDTIVTDKKGNYIHDLTQKDFKVWEDNKEQTIKSFSYESGTSPSANPQRRYLILFFDNSTMDFGEQARARDAAAKFIDANAAPNRVMAVVEFGGTLQITQNFTASAERLKQAVAGVKSSAVASNAPPADSTTPAIPTQQSGVQVASLGTPQIGMPSLGNAETTFGARTVLLALRELAKDLTSIPGRKTLVFMSSGFRVTDELLAELTATVDACNKSNVAIYPIDARGLVAINPVGPPGAKLVRPGRSARLMSATFTDSGDAGSRPHLVFVQHSGGGSPGGGGAGGGAHGGSPGGSTGGTGAPGGGGSRGGSPTGGTGTTGGRGGTGTGPVNSLPASNFYNSNFQPRQILPQIPPSASDNQQVLYELANGTNGFVIVNTNDLLGGMEKIGKEMNEYYVVGYAPSETPEGSCHTLKVKVDRGDVVVRSRSGYCNVKPADLLAGKPVEKQLENQANGTQSGTIMAAIQTPYFYTSANTARVNLAMDIAAGSIKFEKVKGKQHATLNILGIAYKADNSVAARFSDGIDLDFDGKKEVEEFAKQPFHYENQFDVASGQYNLKVVFSSGGEAFGKLETPLTVDAYDGKQFGLSSMALSKDIRRVSDSATGLDAALMEDHTPLVTHGMQILPAATYKFKKTDNTAVYAEVYEPLLTSANPPQVGVQMKITDRKSGQAKFDSGLQNVQAYMQKGNPVIPIGMKLPVNTLDPGSYEVAFQAVDGAGHKSTARTADFEVE